MRHPNYLLLDGHTTLLNAGDCLRKSKRANELENYVQEWLEKKYLVVLEQLRTNCAEHLDC